MDEREHEPGCHRNHSPRQRCGGPEIEARRERLRVAEQQAAPVLRQQRESLPARRTRELDWFASPRAGAVLELVPGVATAIVWLASVPDSVQYDELGPLPYVALAPSPGWLWRGRAGWLLAPFTWGVRVALIWIAMFMWSSANDYGQIEDGRLEYNTYCCEPAFRLGMHAALAGAVATSAISAYYISRPRTVRAGARD